MKITRDGNTFAVEVEHEAQAEALEAVLRTVALGLDAPSLVNSRSEPRSPIAGVTLSLSLNPAEFRPPPALPPR